MGHIYIQCSQIIIDAIELFSRIDKLVHITYDFPLVQKKVFIGIVMSRTPIRFDHVNFEHNIEDTPKLFKSSGCNFGNCVFQYAVKELFFDAEYHVFGSSKIILQVQANLIHNHSVFIDYAQNLYYQCKDYESVLVLSIGQQMALNQDCFDVPEPIRQFLLEVSKKTKNILTRGAYTTRIIESIGIKNVIPVGCPSLMINSDKSLGYNIRKKIQSGNIKKMLFGIHDVRSKLSQHVIMMCKNHDGMLILQDDIHFLELSRNGTTCDYIKNVYTSAYTKHFATYDIFVEFMKTHTIFFNNVPKWLDYMSQYDCYVGLKIHGTICGLMAGIMSICIVHDKRLLELTEQCHIPSIAPNVFLGCKNVKDCIEKSHHDMLLFDSNRTIMANIYCDNIRAMGLHPSKHLQHIAS